MFQILADLCSSLYKTCNVDCAACSLNVIVTLVVGAHETCHVSSGLANCLCAECVSLCIPLSNSAAVCYHTVVVTLLALGKNCLCSVECGLTLSVECEINLNAVSCGIDNLAVCINCSCKEYCLELVRACSICCSVSDCLCCSNTELELCALCSLCCCCVLDSVLNCECEIGNVDCAACVYNVLCALVVSCYERLNLVCCLTNDAGGYVPYIKAYEEGSYEVLTTENGPKTAGILVNSMVNLLNSLK